MAHEVESMFYVREVPWHGLGINVEDAPCSATALKHSGLDWNVLRKPIQVNGKEIEDYFANVRDSDDKVLGIVGKDYRIVQNREAFAFTDMLLGQEGIRYESAGSLQGGKRVWMLACMESRVILGDEIVPYLLFTNGHDGRHAVRVAITPIRVVCQNTLNLALRKAQRSWATIHIGRLEDKLQEATRTLQLTGRYMYELDQTAERLVETRIDDERLKELIEKVIPLPEDYRRHNRVHELRQELLARYHNAPDLQRFRGTGWGFVNAVSDMVGHSKPKRLTPSFNENRFSRVTGGSAELDRATRFLTA
ncbi:MAG: DUF932 domain-containing protein [Syntrophomonadaceae bacterium]|jgi:phage/plasmid-like protein (TIGR03299 family)